MIDIRKLKKTNGNNKILLIFQRLRKYPGGAVTQDIETKTIRARKNEPLRKLLEKPMV